MSGTSQTSTTEAATREMGRAVEEKQQTEELYDPYKDTISAQSGREEPAAVGQRSAPLPSFVQGSSKDQPVARAPVRQMSTSSSINPQEGSRPLAPVRHPDQNVPGSQSSWTTTPTIPVNNAAGPTSNLEPSNDGPIYVPGPFHVSPFHMPFAMPPPPQESSVPAWGSSTMPLPSRRYSVSQQEVPGSRSRPATTPVHASPSYGVTPPINPYTYPGSSAPQPVHTSGAYRTPNSQPPSSTPIGFQAQQPPIVSTPVGPGYPPNAPLIPPADLSQSQPAAGWYVNGPQPVATQTPVMSTPAPASYSSPAGHGYAPNAPRIPPGDITQSQPAGWYGTQAPARKKTDAFVASDPFRPHSHSQSKADKPSSSLTFDDIPMPGTVEATQPTSTWGSAPYPGTGSSHRPPTSSHTSPYYSGGAQRPHTVPTPIGPSPYPPSHYQTTPHPSSGQWGTSPPVVGTSPPYHPTPAPHQSPWNLPPTYGQGQTPVPTIPQPPARHDGTAPVVQPPPISPGPVPVSVGRPSTDSQHSDEPPVLPPQRPVTPPVVILPQPTPSPPPVVPVRPEDSPPPHPILPPVVPVRPEGSPAPQPVLPPGHEYSPPASPYRPYRPSSPPYSPYSPIYGGPYPYYPPYTPYAPQRASFWSRVGAALRWPFGRKIKPQVPPTWVGGETSPHVVFVTPSASDSSDSLEKVANFLALTLPSQVYLLLLLRLPSLYFSRVARIFEEADLTLPELKKMALETASRARSGGGGGEFDVQAFESKNSNLPPQYERLKATWEGFIDSVMREWKTFNIISVLLLSAILTILQIEAAAADPITRYAALFSLICALISLLFGCMYIIRFGSMRKTYKAAEWALEAKKTKSVIWWNVWVLLAMPAIWLTWSIILYIVCIMSFVWRTSAEDTTPPSHMSADALLTVRIVISSVLGLGMVYGVAIIATFRRYGEVMERAWKQRIDAWLDEKASNPYWQGSHYPHFGYPPFGSGHTPWGATPGSPTGYPTNFMSPPGGQMSSDPNLPRYGFAADGSGYAMQENPDFLPATSYHPPPEPYDTPDQSRSQSPESNSRTYVTRANTVRNRASYHRQDSMDSAISYASSTDSTPAPPPLRPKAPLGSNFNPPGNAPLLIKPRLAVPPPPNLPPIPGTPMTAFSNRSLGSRSNADSPLPAPGEEDVDLQDNRVRFRSPLVSVQGSSGGTATWGGQSPRSVDDSSPKASRPAGTTSSTSSRSSPNIGPPSTPLFSGGASSSKESLNRMHTTLPKRDESLDDIH